MIHLKKWGLILAVFLSCSDNKIIEPIGVTDETQYLIFFPENIEGAYEASDPFSFIDEKVAALIDRVGATGNESHKLGFSILVPPWVVDRVLPGKMQEVIEAAFDVARKRDVAVYFAVLTHYIWSTRPDLWNFFDNTSPEFSPDNIDNVEWIDWDKRLFFPGTESLTGTLTGELLSGWLRTCVTTARPFWRKLNVYQKISAWQLEKN